MHRIVHKLVSILTGQLNKAERGLGQIVLTYSGALTRVFYMTLANWLVGLTPEENHWRKGDAWSRIGAYRWAAWHFRKFLKYSNDPTVRAHLAWTYAQMGMVESAVEHYRAAYARDKHPAIALGLAQSEANLGNRDAADAVVQLIVSHRHELSHEELASLDTLQKNLTNATYVESRSFRQVV